MKSYNLLTLCLLTAILLLATKTGFAQQKPKWYVTAGAGGADLRNFGSSFRDLQYTVRENNAMIDYGLHSKVDYLFGAGVGLSGTFDEEGILGWDVGMNFRSGGFRLTPEVYEQEGELSDFYRQMLPEFGKTQSFRYWALHMPASINYLPFEYIGFTIGLDLYYQTSSNITDDEYPYGKLGRTMGVSYYTPKYRHPFQLGAHIGVFAPINERIRVDLEFFTDITPRLKVESPHEASYDYNFREMGMRLNTRYFLK